MKVTIELLENGYAVTTEYSETRWTEATIRRYAYPTIDGAFQGVLEFFTANFAGSTTGKVIIERLPKIQLNESN